MLLYALIAISFLFTLQSELISQYWIRDVIIDRRDVFDSTKGNWFFAANLANSLHYTTRQYIIEDELLFAPGDSISIANLSETARNLRATGLFTDVRIFLDSVGYDIYDVTVFTQDRWSTYPSLLLGIGGGETNYGIKPLEFNFLGTGTQIEAEALNRSENDIGWQGGASVYQRRLLRSDYTFSGSLLANRYRTEQSISLYQPYRTLSSNYSYGIIGSNVFGSDFFYRNNSKDSLIGTHERILTTWFSKAWKPLDRIFITGLIEIEDIQRGQEEFTRAFDNSGKILIGFSSVAQDFIPTNKLNTYQTEDLCVGGYGMAILGKTFPIGTKGESIYYVGGQGEQSYYDDKLYIFGQLTGSSGFERSRGHYTYQEFLGLGFYRFTKEFLLAARIRQQTVWNWNTVRQLILDNDAGLRGYQVNRLVGDNRIIANLEFRIFPDYRFWIFNMSGAVFWDVGAVWNQDNKLYQTRFHNSAGLGIRFHDQTATGSMNVYRFDFAFNFDEMGFTGIIFSTDQLFSVFKKHDYKLPEIFGLEYDYE
ncbi:MAG: Omp85 protein [Bacteroidota bacterium]|nr:Omp85 protein [Bacteroidota bacterium]